MMLMLLFLERLPRSLIHSSLERKIMNTLSFSNGGLFGLAALVTVLAGCASGVKLSEDAPVESRTGTAVTPAASSGVNAGTSSTSQSRVVPVDLTGSTATNAAGNLARIIYFDYDSFVVKEEFRPAVEGHAKLLSADRKKKLSIEGHTDERGGREYNLALGQKRAESVAKALTLLGATDAQVEAVSFGKERPAANGSDEAAFAKNRRVEINNR
jgi:peptidoglycan-associated lipoprotein